METTSNIVNAELRKVLFGIGNYRPLEYSLGQAVLVNDGDYHYSVKTDGNIFVLQTTDDWFECPANEVDWRMFLELLETVDVDDNGNILEPFQHLPVGADKRAVYQWIEWFFEVKITEADLV